MPLGSVLWPPCFWEKDLETFQVSAMPFVLEPYYKRRLGPREKLLLWPGSQNEKTPIIGINPMYNLEQSYGRKRGEVEMLLESEIVVSFLKSIWFCNGFYVV